MKGAYTAFQSEVEMDVAFFFFLILLFSRWPVANKRKIITGTGIRYREIKV